MVDIDTIFHLVNMLYAASLQMSQKLNYAKKLLKHKISNIDKSVNARWRTSLKTAVYSH